MSARDCTIKDLVAARNLIAHPDSWSPVGVAFDRDGSPWSSVGCPDAVRFSAAGAVAYTTRSGHGRDEVWKALHDTLHDWLRRLGVEEVDTEFTTVNLFNAESPHAMVLGLFDETIARLQRSGD